MPSIKITYFEIPARAEATYMALTLGGIEYEKEVLDYQQWGQKKPSMRPLQLPLMEVDGKVVSQSIAQLRYACKLAKYEGKPLYPEDPFQALLVDEMCDVMGDLFAPMGKTFGIQDQKEKVAARAGLVKKGGDIEKWAAFVDKRMGENGTGFAVGDCLTMADLLVFASVCSLRSGYFEGVPKDCFDHLPNIAKHRRMMAAIPKIKALYASETNPLYAPLKCE